MSTCRCHRHPGTPCLSCVLDKPYRSLSEALAPSEYHSRLLACKANARACLESVPNNTANIYDCPHNFFEDPSQNFLFKCSYCKRTAAGKFDEPHGRWHSGSGITTRWKSQDGRKTPICELERVHLHNIMTYLIKRAAAKTRPGQSPWFAVFDEFNLTNVPDHITNMRTGQSFTPMEFVYHLYPSALDIAREIEFRVNTKHTLTTQENEI